MSFNFAAAAIAALLATTPAAPVESEVEAPGPNGALRGTLLAPPDAHAVVLIVPGSGAVDRNGNGPGVRAATYQRLAEALAERGIASVRIDKRGLRGSAGAVPDANAVSMADYATDVHSWAQAIRARTGARCVWVLGHSEGGLVGLLAGRRPQDICGLMLVAAGGRRMADVVREQLRANPANAPLLDQALAGVEALEAGRHVETEGLDPALMPLFAPPLQNYWIDLFSHDPAQLISELDLPILIVQGGRDLHTTREDALRLADAQPGARLIVIDEANHVLRLVAGEDRASNIATYADASLPLAPGIVEAIVDFVAVSPAGGGIQ